MPKNNAPRADNKTEFVLAMGVLWIGVAVLGFLFDPENMWIFGLLFGLGVANLALYLLLRRNISRR